MAKFCNPIVDAEMDSLFILPLRLIPFKTEGLPRARVVKNNHMQGVLELYSDRETGSGQVAIEDLPEMFRWKEGHGHPDMQILHKLGPLPSYDVYSLRRSLRDHGIPVNNISELKLSEEKNRELTGYMSSFTLPLIRQIYGEDDNMKVGKFEDIVGLFKDPDVKKALSKLKMMAEKLQLRIDQIPRFIEDYGDIFLSLSYYRNCLDRLDPLIEGFVYAMKEMRKSFQVKNDRTLMAEMDRIEQTMNRLLQFLRRTFDDFDARSKDMWNNLSAAKFEQVKSIVENAHTTVGGVLCGLTVKMNAWVIRFPNPKSGGPGQKGEFIMTDMRPGLNEVVAIARGSRPDGDG